VTQKQEEAETAGWGSAVARNDEAAVFPEQTLSWQHKLPP